MKNIILVEDHTIVRNGIRMILESINGIHVVAEYSNGLEALEKIKRGIKADIIITDVNMPELDGLGFCKAVKQVLPDTKIIILSMVGADQHITDAFDAGANAYLLKSIDNAEMAFAIHVVLHGGKYLCTELVEGLLKNRHKYPAHRMPISKDFELSDREVEILELIGEGYTNLQIAEKLFISKRTVEGHRQSLLDKAGARNTAALMKFALIHGLL